jgi:hypothetical protein
MPTYSYKCSKDGYFDLKQRMADHAEGVCPKAPVLDIEAMANCGMPGAFNMSGDRMTKRHHEAGQDHHWWRDDMP